MNRRLRLPAALAAAAFCLIATGCGAARPAVGLHSASSREAAAVHYPVHSSLQYRYMTDTPDGQQTKPYGYDLVDVGPYPSLINKLPAGQRALVWIGSYLPASCTFALSDTVVKALVRPLAGDPKVAGYYLADEADDAVPAYGGHCHHVAAQITARSRLVHRLAPGAFTYEVVTEAGNFAAFAKATDVLGTDPYPCVRGAGCDWSLIPRYIAALHAAHVARYWAVLQAFSAEQWRYPTAHELQIMIGQWEHSDWQGEQTFAWDYAGGSLAAHPRLLAVLRALNLGQLRGHARG